MGWGKRAEKVCGRGGGEGNKVSGRVCEEQIDQPVIDVRIRTLGHVDWPPCYQRFKQSWQVGKIG